MILNAFLSYVDRYCDEKDVQFNLSEKSIRQKGNLQNVVDKAEMYYKVADIYLWLSLRFEPFCDLEKAYEFQEYISTMIDAKLERSSRTAKTFRLNMLKESREKHKQKRKGKQRKRKGRKPKQPRNIFF